MDNLKTALKRPTVILKLAEALLTIICAIVVNNNYAAAIASQNYVVSVAIHGYIIVQAISISSYLLNTHLHAFIYLGVALTGGVMSYAAGGVLLATFSSTSALTSIGYLLWAGIIALINGFVYLADVFFTYKEVTLSTPS